MQAPDLFHLKVVNHFVSCEVRVPSSRANDDSESPDVVCGIAGKAEAIRTFRGRAEYELGDPVYFTESRLYEAD